MHLGSLVPYLERHVDLNALADFNLVAASGGIAHASRVSGRPKASLSRRIMELEASLGLRLFERGPRSLRLTEEGEILHARSAGPVSEIAEVGQILRDGSAQPQGRLRVNVPLLFGELLMGRLAAEFIMAYPEVQLDVTTEDRAVDLVAEGYDVVIRTNPKPTADLVGRCFARCPLLVVAAASLDCPLNKFGPLPGGSIPVVALRASPDVDVWHISGSPSDLELSLRPVLLLPSLVMIQDAVRTGIGAAKLPRLLVADDLASGRLVCWAAASDSPVELWALHASRRFASAKVKAFMKFLDAAFPGTGL